MKSELYSRVSFFYFIGGKVEMNSTKLFNRLRDYLKQMCDSIDEIKGNRKR